MTPSTPIRPRLPPERGLFVFRTSTRDREMPTRNYKPIAIFYEHPDWFRPLFAELERREIPFERVDANAHTYDPAEKESPYSLVVNRASPSAYLRSEAESTFDTLNWLRHLDRLACPVVNGS